MKTDVAALAKRVAQNEVLIKQNDWLAQANKRFSEKNLEEIRLNADSLESEVARVEALIGVRIEEYHARLVNASLQGLHEWADSIGQVSWRASNAAEERYFASLRTLLHNFILQRQIFKKYPASAINYWRGLCRMHLTLLYRLAEHQRGQPDVDNDAKRLREAAVEAAEFAEVSILVSVIFILFHSFLNWLIVHYKKAYEDK